MGRFTRELHGQTGKSRTASMARELRPPRGPTAAASRVAPVRPSVRPNVDIPRNGFACDLLLNTLYCNLNFGCEEPPFEYERLPWKTLTEAMATPPPIPSNFG